MLILLLKEFAMLQNLDDVQKKNFHLELKSKRLNEEGFKQNKRRVYKVFVSPASNESRCNVSQTSSAISTCKMTDLPTSCAHSFRTYQRELKI